MRWNCPHCEELVTAGIDFENTKKAYVRCAKCNGMALIHRSAALADYVKARRLEEEAQLEAELRLTQAATANTRVQTMEAQIRGLNEKLNNERMINARLAAVQAASAGQLGAIPASMPPLPASAMMSMGMGEEMMSMPTPPPFRPSFEAMEEGSIQSAVAAAPPAFNYTKPPAFLMRPNALETIDRMTAIQNAVEIPNDLDAKTINIANINTDENIDLQKTLEIAHDAAPAAIHDKPSIRPMIALWVAASIAIASGAYLIHEGKKALAPTLAPPAPTEPVEADVIRSKANSAVRTNLHGLVIVRVPRAVLRNGPSVAADAIQTLEHSSVANVLEIKDGWMKIESPKISSTDRTAWVRADLVAPIPN